MRHRVLLLAGLMVLAAASLSAQTSGPPETVRSVDLKRYQGRWYEIAKYPNRFEKVCARNVTAEYAIRPDGRISVTNTCVKASGKVKVAEGEAKIDDKQTNAKLRVRFAPNFLSWLPWVWGQYWILELDAEYRHVLVGDSSRDYFWILSRDPVMSEPLYSELLKRAEAKGFDPKRVVRTEQGR